MYLVTGGAGFIGSNLVAALDESRIGKIAVCDRLREDGKWRNLAKRELAEVVNPEHLLEFLEDNRTFIEAVIHMGAISSTTETDADLILTSNFKLSLSLWKWCTAHHTRFIYASSAATYGDGSKGFVDDASPVGLARMQPLNPYGWSKHLFDRRIARAMENGDAHPPQWAGLKFFNVYGPNEYHKGTMQSVVSHVFPVASKGETAKLFKSHNPEYKDGGQLRDFIYVDRLSPLYENPHNLVGAPHKMLKLLQLRIAVPRQHLAVGIDIYPLTFSLLQKFMKVQQVMACNKYSGPFFSTGRYHRRRWAAECRDVYIIEHLHRTKIHFTCL